MNIEFEGKAWIFPAELFTDLRDPESAARFKALMKFQYGFSDESLDESIERLRWQEYWKKEGPKHLATVRNEENPRFRQVGGLLFYLGSNEKYYVSFGDTIIERFDEEEILLIEKTEIDVQSGIKVEFLDDGWEKVIREGELVGYEEAGPDREGGPPGWYLVQVGEEIKKVADWLMLGGTNVRFSLK